MSSLRRLFTLGTGVLLWTGCGGASSATESSALSQCGGTHEGDVVIRSADDARALGPVETIHGHLTLLGDLKHPLVIAAEDLGCLRHVTGRLLVGGQPMQAGALELSALERIDDGIAVGFVVNAADTRSSLSLPQLRVLGLAADPEPQGLQIAECELSGGIFAPQLETVHGLVSIGPVHADVIDLGALETVSQWLAITFDDQLEELHLESLRSVKEQLIFRSLGRVSFAELDALTSQLSARETRIESVGCARHDADASPDCS